MPLKVSNIRLPVEEPESALADAVAQRLGVKSDELTQWRILRKSLDARSRTGLRFVYSAVVHLPEEDRRFRSDAAPKEDVSGLLRSRFDEPSPGDEPLDRAADRRRFGAGGTARRLLSGTPRLRPLDSRARSAGEGPRPRGPRFRRRRRVGRREQLSLRRRRSRLLQRRQTDLPHVGLRRRLGARAIHRVRRTARRSSTNIARISGAIGCP